MLGYCFIDYDRWELTKTVFAVHRYERNKELSTGVSLTIENVNTGEFHKLVVPVHSIEWL